MRVPSTMALNNAFSTPTYGEARVDFTEPAHTPSPSYTHRSLPGTRAEQGTKDGDFLGKQALELARKVGCGRIAGTTHAARA